MDTALPEKFPFKNNLDRNLAKVGCTENHVCTSCDKVVLGLINPLLHIGHYSVSIAKKFDFTIRRDDQKFFL